MTTLEEIRRDLAAAKLPSDACLSDARAEMELVFQQTDAARRRLDARAPEYIQFLLNMVDARDGLRQAILEAIPEAQEGSHLDRLIELVKARGYAHDRVWQELKLMADEGKLSIGNGGWVLPGKP